MSHRIHTITVGDSLQRIAKIYDVPWKDLADINHLEYPYIDDSLNSTIHRSNPAVAKLGDIIFIDTPTTTPETLVSLKDLENQAYGIDLDIFMTNNEADVTITETTRKELSSHEGDLKLCKGLINLRQQLLIRLMTPKGSLLLHPEFGCDLSKLTGLKATKQNLIKMQLEAKSAILSDFRVTDVRNLTISYSSGFCVIDCDIIPVSPYEMFHFNEILNQ